MVIVLPMAVGLALAYLSALIILHRSVQPSTPLHEVLEATQSPLLIFLFLFLAVVVAPFLEELIFRGYFYHVVSFIKGKGFAIFWISLVFAFLHVGQYWGDWVAVGMVTILGFALTALRAWTGTTLASVVMHYVYNAGVTLIPVFMLLFISGIQDWTQIQNSGPVLCLRSSCSRSSQRQSFPHLVCASGVRGRPSFIQSAMSIGGHLERSRQSSQTSSSSIVCH